jgi:NTE family protein
MDNVPLAAMKALKTGPNVIVALGAEGRTAYNVEYDSIPGLGELTLALLNPFARRRLPQVPNILQVIILSMVANRRLQVPLTDTDILIRPDIPEDLRFTSWERHNEVFLRSYRGVASWIQARVAEADPRLAGVLSAVR